MTLSRLPFFACLLLLLCGQLLAGLVHSDDRIVFIGDSITGQGARGAKGWMARIGQGLQNVDAQNQQTLVPLGGSGHSVSSWMNLEKRSREKSVFLDIKQYDVRAELDQHADIVVIMLGMNDVLSTGLPNTPEGIAKWKEQFRALVQSVAERATPRVLALATPTPCTEDPMSPKNVLMDEMVIALNALAEEENCIVLPTRETAWQLLKEGRKCKPDFHFVLDQVHPNTSGHAMIAAGMLRGLGETEAGDALFEEALALGGVDASGALSYALTLLSPEDVQATTRFQLEVFHGEGTLEFDLPDGWELKVLESGESATRYELAAKLDQLMNRMVIHSGEKMQVVEIPAAWLVGTGNIGWLGWKQGAYDVELGRLASDEQVRLGEGFGNEPAKLELEAGTPVVWKTFVGNVNYGGAGNPDVLDFAQVNYFRGGEVAYGLRWIYSPVDRPVEVKISQKGFSGTNHVQLWMNGELVHAGRVKEAKGQLFESQLHQGWNLMSFKSNFYQWQWQLSLGLSGLHGDALDDLRYAVSPSK